MFSKPLICLITLLTKSLTLENDQTPAEFQSTEMNSLIKEADELVVRAEQTYDTATEVAKTCLFRNAK